MLLTISANDNIYHIKCRSSIQNVLYLHVGVKQSTVRSYYHLTDDMDMRVRFNVNNRKEVSYETWKKRHLLVWQRKEI